jgi:putative MATE family efflux protein
MLSAGGAARISMALGRGEKETAEQVVATGFIMAVIIGSFFTVFGLSFIYPILRVLGADEITMPYAEAYMRIILCGAIPNMVTFSLNRYIIAQGRALFAMVTLIISCSINFILTPLFIFAFGWGVAGAALATIIAWSVAAVWVALFFIRKKGLLQLRLRKANIRWSIVLSIISIGVAPFTLQIVNSLTSTILINSLRIYGGAMAISAMGAIQAVLQFIQMPLFGLNQGSQPIIGYNFGAKNYARVRQTLRIVLLTGTSIGIIGFSMAMLIPGVLIGLFGTNAEMLAIGERAIRIFLMFFPAVGILVCGSNFFSMTGRPQLAMTITLGRQVMLVVGLFLLPSIFGLYGVFGASPFADGFGLAIGLFLILREWKRLKKLELEAG